MNGTACTYFFSRRAPHANDRNYIRKQFESAARFQQTTNLAAWTTAYIETNPDEAIRQIEQLYFRSKFREQEELVAVLRAISVSTGAENLFQIGRDVDLRLKVLTAYHSLLDQHPSMAGWVARDLLRWRRKALVQKLESLRREGDVLDPASANAVDMYLSEADEFASIVRTK